MLSSHPYTASPTHPSSHSPIPPFPHSPTPIIVLALFLTAMTTARAADFRAPLMAKAPNVDGKIDPAEWAGAVRVDGFGWEGVLERRRVTGYVGATETH